MKSTLALLLAFSSLSALAQPRQNECPRPGLIESKEAAPTGEEVQAAHQRAGSMDIPDTFAVAGILRTRIYRNFVDRVCVPKAYVETQRVCEPVSPEIALGRGNDLLRGIYNMNETVYRRANALVQSLRFAEGRSPVEKEDIAVQLVTQLNRMAGMAGIPKSWAELVGALQQAVREGMLTFQAVEDITVINQAHNQRALGFLPLEGATVKQGTGNGRLNSVFDLGLSPAARAARLQGLLLGIPAQESINLANAFVIHASSNGIPSNWDQFVLMMRAAVSSRAGSDRTLQAVIVDNELQNRASMGFEISAELCRMMNVERVVNVVEIRQRQEHDRTISKPYEINFMSAPLLQNEKETMNLTTNGLRALDLRITSSVNRYQVKGTEVGGVMKFAVVGTRLAVRPPNTIRAKFNKVGDTVTVRITNQGFNPKAGQKVLVKVRYINGGFLDSDTLGVETYELNGATELVQVAATRHKKIDTVKISLQIVGSPYYSADFSEEIKAKD